MRDDLNALAMVVAYVVLVILAAAALGLAVRVFLWTAGFAR